MFFQIMQPYIQHPNTFTKVEVEQVLICFKEATGSIQRFKNMILIYNLKETVDNVFHCLQNTQQLFQQGRFYFFFFNYRYNIDQNMFQRTPFIYL